MACLYKLYAIYSKIVNCLKNPGPPKERLNKISFISFYENINT